MTIRIGVIGAGTIGQEHIRRLSTKLSGASITAVADPNDARAQAIAQGLPGCVVADAHDLIGLDCVDAVVIASWAETHAEYVLACIDSRKPVFCEKPLATTQDDCTRILDAEVNAGRRLVQVGFMRRYDPDFVELRGVVEAGDLGAPLLMYCAHRMGSVPDGYTTRQVINDAIVHEIDTARWLFGDEIESVQVLPSRQNPNSSGDLLDPLVTILKNNSGVLIVVEASANGRYGYDITGEVVAQSGRVSLASRASVEIHRFVRSERAMPADWRIRFEQAYDVELQHWLYELNQGQPLSGPSTWDGLAAAAVTDALHSAVETATAVNVSLPAKPALYA